VFLVPQETVMPAQLSIVSSKSTVKPPASFADIAGMVDGAAARDGTPCAGLSAHFAQDREIYGEGDDADTYYKVVSGVVRTCKFLSDGRRQIDAFHVAGDFFGFELGAERSLSAEAVCDCTIIAYRRPRASAPAADDEALSRQLLSHAMRSLARAQEHSLLLGRRSAVEKVAAFLIDWAGQSKGDKVVTLAMTRQDIADYLGLTIETVSRTMSQLEREGVIELPTARQIRLKDLIALRGANS
jgi:CRP/FNR family transcriptional regulator, nitrogen fixation regulation protein